MTVRGTWTIAALVIALFACRDAAPTPRPAPVPDAGAAVCPPCEPAPPPEPPPKTGPVKLTKVGFEDLPGWRDDAVAEAVPAFLASCEVLSKRGDGEAIGHDGHSGTVRDWRKACRAAKKVPAGDHAAARAFFEAEFTPYAAEGEDGAEGKFTAYAVQEVRGSLTRHGKYRWPLYKRPPDLVMIDLSKFVDGSGGKRIWGRVDAKTGELVKYYTRKEIRQGALDGQGLELIWLDDRVDALWTEIEGSGKAIMDDGSVRWIEFAGKNGRGYKAPGKLLKEMGEIQKGTMPHIRAWFDANPGRFDEIVDQSSSVVFFQFGDREGGIGSQGVVLTPRRSIAVDRAYVAASTPIWVDTRAPEANRPDMLPWQRLMIAQDTGGGILGPVRGDLYMGDDRDATDIAGRLGGPGRWWLLLPKSVRVH